jgi:hypothetical protein
MKNTLKFFYAISAVTLIAIALPTKIVAQDETSIGFAPESYRLDLDKGDTVQKDITIWTKGDRELVLYPIVSTFKPIDGIPGTSTLLFDNVSGPYDFSAADWIVTELDEIIVSPGANGNQTFTVTISVPTEIPDGLYRVKVSFTTMPEFNPETAIEVRNPLQIGVPILVEVGDPLLQSLVFHEVDTRDGYSSFYTDRDYYNEPPVKFSTSLKNDGETYVTPTGEIIIYNWLDEEIDKIQFNPNNQSLLDDEIGSYDNLWKPEQSLLKTVINNKLGIGKFKAKLIVSYATDTPSYSVLNNEVSFWIVPWEPIVTLLGTIALIIAIKSIRRNSEK